MFARTLAALAALALTACGQPPAPSGAPPAAGGNTNVVLQSTQNLPDWLLIARQRDCVRRDCVGDIMFNQRTITRNPDGTADIWLQVRHANPQNYPIETATARTIISFTTERLHYRFNCSTNQFIVLERQIIGAGDTVVAREEPRQIWRAPAGGGIVPVALPVACRGG